MLKFGSLKAQSSNVLQVHFFSKEDGHATFTDIENDAVVVAAKLHEAGAQFVAKSPAADALVAAITGQQLVSLMESDKQDRSAPRLA